MFLIAASRSHRRSSRTFDRCSLVYRNWRLQFGIPLQLCGEYTRENYLKTIIGEQRFFNIFVLCQLQIENLVENYNIYFKCLPDAEKILSVLLKNLDFIQFLKYPTIAQRKPDITSFLHLPAEVISILFGCNLRQEG